MPLLINPQGHAEALSSNAVLEMVGRNCKLNGKYKILKDIPSFAIKSQFIAYASPDSTYAVTKKLLDAAEKEIIIGIYDFSAEYMKEIILNAMQRGVSVALMLDIDSKDEQALFDELSRMGCEAVEAPSCASKSIHYFPCAHEKVIVIDKEWCMVQSGNYSNNSIPLNETDGGNPKHFVKGNRDMGIAIKSKELSAFFTKVLNSDMKLEQKAESVEAIATVVRPNVPDLVEAVPKNLPANLFKSRTFDATEEIKVTPILTPDNYLSEIIPFIASAKKSIWIENQYIRGSQKEIVKLLEAIKNAKTKHEDLDVRIILGKLFGQKDYDNEVINIKNLKKEFGLALGEQIRYINTHQFVHCHNKVIIVDEKKVLISSQNWSNTGVASNREAGLLLEYPDVSKYFAEIVASDWNSAFQEIPKPGKATVTPEAVKKGNYVKVVAADYQRP